MQVLLEQWHNDTLVVPEFQREYVWDNGKASRLAESLLLNIPIPVLYFAETTSAKWEIIDGHQRVKSVIRFLDNEFALTGVQVLTEFARKRFHQLPPREQRFLERRTMRAVVISPDSHPNMKFEVFSRLNTGAVALNAQEIRNALYGGSLNRLLRELARTEGFRHCIGTPNPRRRFVDEELALRFFAVREGLRTYRPPLTRFMNQYMGKYRNARRDALHSRQELFEQTMERIAETLGDGAFRVTDSAGRPIENAVNRALFEAQAVAFSWTTTRPTTARKRAARRHLARLYEDDDFNASIRLATGDRARTLTRTAGVVGALRTAGFRVQAPRFLTK
jgi:hypothetical protein